MTQFGNAWQEFIQKLGNYMLKNGMKWDKPTKCWQRVYFNADGSVDYLLYNFIGKDEDKPSKEQEIEYTRLLNLFLQNAKIKITAPTKFSQCGAMVYNP